MYVAQLTVAPASSSDSAREAVSEATLSYLATFRRHGQQYGDEIAAWVGGRLQVTLELAGPDAHRHRNHSSGGLRELRVLRRLCKSPPRWKLVSDAARRRKPVPDWRKETSLYLWTGFLCRTSAVSAGSTGKPVPTYLLPIDDKKIESIYSWAAYYRGHDLLWVGSAKLEIPAYRELADPRSEMSSWGREVCRQIERATGLPTYYYLQRYFGWRNEHRERNRKCPGCGRAWARNPAGSVHHSIESFEFRCARCRLISCVGIDAFNRRYARIGDARR